MMKVGSAAFHRGDTWWAYSPVTGSHQLSAEFRQLWACVESFERYRCLERVTYNAGHQHFSKTWQGLLTSKFWHWEREKSAVLLKQKRLTNLSLDLLRNRHWTLKILKMDTAPPEYSVQTPMYNHCGCSLTYKNIKRLKASSITLLEKLPTVSTLFSMSMVLFTTWAYSKSM